MRDSRAAAGAVRFRQRLLGLSLRLTGLRSTELDRSLRLGGAYGLMLASLYVLKPTRNALFLSRVGAEQLPVALAAVAVVGTLTAFLLSSASKAVNIARLSRWIFGGFALTLLGWWATLRFDPQLWHVFLFYVWVNLYGQLATGIIWLVAGAVVDARESRRVFAFVGALGIAGAVLGGGLTQEAAGRLGTINLLPLCLILLLASGGLLQSVRSPSREASRQRPQRERDSGSGVWHDLKRFALLRVLLAMTLLSAIASSIIDVQFNALVEASLPSEDDKTAFFGSFFAYLNAGAFLFQLSVTPRVLSRYGLGVALMALPAALALGSGFVFLVPGLLSATVLKASDAGLRHSLYKSGVEVLFVPLPSAVKRRVRMFLEAAVDNLGTGLGALLTFAITASVGVRHHYLAGLSIASVAVWVAIASRARAAHVDAFRAALEQRQLQPEELSMNTADPRVRAALRRSLFSNNPRELSYVLDWIRDAREPDIVERVVELLQHPDAEIRAKSLHLLVQDDPQAPAVPAERLLLDEDAEVRRRAAVLLARRAAERRGRAGEREVLKGLLSRDEAVVRGAALGAVGELGHADLLDAETTRNILRQRGREVEWVRRELARALGAAEPTSSVRGALRELIADDSRRVVQEALRAAGRLRDPELVGLLLDQLRAPTHRAAATDALVLYEESVVPRLVDALEEADALALPLSIVRVLSRMEIQASVDVLVGVLPSASRALHHAALRALKRLRARAGDLRFPEAALRRQLSDEVAYQLSLRRAISVQPDSAVPADRLLYRALREKRKDSLDSIFGLLGLIYPYKDMQNAFAAVSSEHPRARANAIEFLDNVLTRQDKERVLPLLESEARPPVLVAGPRASRRGLDELAAGRDAWLRACAVFSAGRDPAFSDLVESALSDPDPVVREVARACLDRSEAAC